MDDAELMRQARTCIYGTKQTDALLVEMADRIEALIAERDALKAAQIEAIRAALEAAAEVCAGIRQRISNGPMPEGARFDYEQAIRSLDPAAIAAKLKGDGDERD